jgi:hypothetical protein
MEPQIVDYYNELPHSVNVIDKMNEELSETQNENEKLKRELEEFHKLMNRFNMPRIKVDTVEEYQLFESKLEEFKNFIEEELSGTNLLDIVNHYHNYGLSDDTMPGPGCIEDEDGFIYRFINKLDELTNHVNREWCEYRILTSFEVFIKTEGDVHNGEVVSLSNIIIGLNNNSDEEQLPKIYCELSNKFTPAYGPEWSQIDYNINMMNIPYYKCEKCGKYDDYGETEIYGGLFCIDCQPSPQ